MRSTDEVGDLLKACRDHARLSQLELAIILRVDRTTITKVETGVIKQPSYALVKEWAEATNCVELVGIHLSGSRDGWKKLRTMELIFGSMKQLMEQVNLFRVKKSVRPPLR